MPRPSDRSPRRGLDLDAADAERPGSPFTIRANGQVIELCEPQTLSWSRLLTATSNWRAFTDLLVPPQARPAVAGLSWHRMRHLVDTYRIHHGLCATPVDDQRLAGLIARYGSAIEQDLAARQIDMLTLWQQRRWRQLLALIDALPRNTAFVEALSDDDELAERFPPQQASTGRPRPTMAQYSPELEMAITIYDRLGELIQAVTASAGRRPPKIVPHPRPRTAADRVRKRRAEAQHRSLVARMLPRGPQPAPRQPPTTGPRRAAGDPVPASPDHAPGSSVASL